MYLKGLHHGAIIGSDYARTKYFYSGDPLLSHTRRSLLFSKPAYTMIFEIVLPIIVCLIL